MEVMKCMYIYLGKNARTAAMVGSGNKRVYESKLGAERSRSEQQSAESRNRSKRKKLVSSGRWRILRALNCVKRVAARATSQRLRANMPSGSGARSAGRKDNCVENGRVFLDGIVVCPKLTFENRPYQLIDNCKRNSKQNGYMHTCI